MAHNVLAVANRFLNFGERDHIPLTAMHLQKLCYLAHGFCLAFLKERLIDELPQAWAYGPVYPRLYDALKKYGSGQVTELIRENNWATSPSARGNVVWDHFEPAEVSIIEQVHSNYSSYPAFKLSALTHEHGAPWAKTFNSEEKNATIPEDLMENYFRELA
jgi:uncharacterized phage-associated protein